MVIIPSLNRDGSWLEEIEDELYMRGIVERLVGETGWTRIDKKLIHDAILARCWWRGQSICPAVVFEDEKAYLLMLNEEAENYVVVINFEEVLKQEIEGLIRYTECLMKHGYDFPC
jgi:hypothetical protein